MPTYSAPGVYVEVQDNSAYAAPVSITACGIIGAPTQGPVLGKYETDNNTYNTPILITTQQEFVATFGTPSPEFQAPYAAQAASASLRAGKNVTGICAKTSGGTAARSPVEAPPHLFASGCLLAAGQDASKTSRALDFSGSAML